MNNQLCLPINIIKKHSLLNQVKAWNTLLKQVLHHYQENLYIKLFIALLWPQKMKPPCALTSTEVTAEAFPTEPANFPTLPRPVGKRNAKRAPHGICVIQGPVTCFSDQAEDATDKIAVTDICQPKKPPQL